MSAPAKSGLANTPDDLFSDLPRESVDQTSNVICVVDADLSISYCNPAWDRFALQNGGQSALSSLVVNRSLREFIPEPLRRFYDDVFSRARTGSVSFDYECSSPELYRSFRMQVMYLKQYGGFAFINSLRLEHTYHIAGDAAFTPESFAHETAAGFIVMCCHCRRTRRHEGENVWDWVPEHLKRPPLTVSHGICPTCAAYFYPDEINQR
jgi:hypothetical protein